jgi:hypothetical protein
MKRAARECLAERALGRRDSGKAAQIVPFPSLLSMAVVINTAVIPAGPNAPEAR